MAPLVSFVTQEIRSEMPLPQTTVNEEFESAREKLRKHSIALIPRKRNAPEPEEAEVSGNASGSARDAASAKRRKLPTEEDAFDLTGLLSAPPKDSFGTLPDSHNEESVQSWVEQFRRQLKGKQQEFKVHLETAKNVLKKQHSKAELVQTVTQFGLPRTMAVCMNVKSLSKLDSCYQDSDTACL